MYNCLCKSVCVSLSVHNWCHYHTERNNCIYLSPMVHISYTKIVMCVKKRTYRLTGMCKVCVKLPFALADTLHSQWPIALTSFGVSLGVNSVKLKLRRSRWISCSYINQCINYRRNCIGRNCSVTSGKLSFRFALKAPNWRCSHVTKSGIQFCRFWCCAREWKLSNCRCYSVRIASRVSEELF